MPETPSLLQALGLSISVWKPNIGPGNLYVTHRLYTPRGQLLENELDERISAYSHSMDTVVGFRDATLTFEGSQEYIESWIADGLNRHIEVRNAAMDTIWEGFVNSYSARVGSLAKTGGPVLDIVNRCSVLYTPLDFTCWPPARGPQTLTTSADDTDSQSKYGVMEAIIQGGELTDSNATLIRDTQLRDLAYPKDATSLSIGSGAAQAASITLNCAGYGTRLAAYIYNTGATGTETVSTKLDRILDTDPNELIAAKREYIESNTYLVSANERDNKTALGVIKSVLALGTSDNRRTFFGVYEDQIPRYWSEPYDALYKFRIADENQDVERYTWGIRQAPWNVRPGQWLFVPDFLAGRQPPPLNLRQDPRAFLIETVKYTAPYTLELSGERFGSAAQILAKKGLSGM